MRLLNFQDVLTAQTTPEAVLGEVGQLPDGRQFKYVRFNAITAQAQLLIPMANTAVTNITATSANGAAQTVFIEESGAAWTVGQFQNAFGLVSGGTGSGQFFKIKDNTVDTLELYPEYRIRTALDTTSDLILVRPNLVRLGPGDSLLAPSTGFYQGFTATVANDYGWVQNRGIGCVLPDTEGAVTINVPIAPSNAVAGSVEMVGGSTINTETMVGIMVAPNTAASLISIADITIG